jgi:hypothetical protein
MGDTTEFPNYQDQPAAAIPVYLVSGAGTGSAKATNPGAPYAMTPLGYQQITSLTTAEGLTVPSGATFAVISAETANVRYRDDGTLPTASAGMPIVAGTTITYSGSLTAIKFIAESGSPVLDISYYK